MRSRVTAPPAGGAAALGLPVSFLDATAWIFAAAMTSRHGWIGPIHVRRQGAGPGPEGGAVPGGSYLALEGSTTVLPATMKRPPPRWWMVLGCFRDGSIQAFTTSRMKRSYRLARLASTTLHSRLA